MLLLLVNEINEWIKVPGKTQLVKKESYETKQYSADSNRTVTKVSLRSSPELSSGIGLGQWGLNVTKKKRTAMDTGSSPPPERYEKTGQDSVSRKVCLEFYNVHNESCCACRGLLVISSPILIKHNKASVIKQLIQFGKQNCLVHLRKVTCCSL